VSAQGFLSGFRRVFDRQANLLTWVATLMLLPMMFSVTADVIGRYILNRPIPAVFEINSYFIMVLVVFFPLAYVQRKKEHVFVSLFTDWLPAKARTLLEIVSMLIGFFCYGFIFFYSMERAVVATRVREYISGIIDMPVWLSKWIVPIGCLAFCLQLLLDITDRLRQVLGRGSEGEANHG
jgi:TRAP-type C4-dicarboxylate transport system permease small subunit